MGGINRECSFQELMIEFHSNPFLSIPFQWSRSGGQGRGSWSGGLGDGVRGQSGLVGGGVR